MILRSELAIFHLLLVFLGASFCSSVPQSSLFRWMPLKMISGYDAYTAGSVPTDSARDSKHFSQLDACADSTCDQIVRQANRLSRIKLVRGYVRDTIFTLDRLVTALDSELIGSASDLKRAIGSTCRAAHIVLREVTQDAVDNEV